MDADAVVDGRAPFTAFIGSGQGALVRRRANVIFGTVLLIERDDESVLAWAGDR